MSMMNKADLSYLNGMLKETSRSSYLDFKIAIKKVIKSWAKLWWNKENNYDSMTKSFTAKTFDDATLGLCGSTNLGINDPSKLGEELDSKKGSCIGLPEWYIVGFPEAIMLSDYFKLGEELGFKASASCVVSEWSLVGIPEGSIHETNVVNDEYNSFGISKCPS